MLNLCRSFCVRAIFLPLVGLMVLVAGAGAARAADGPQTLSQKVRGWSGRRGCFRGLGREGGKLYLEIPGWMRIFCCWINCRMAWFERRGLDRGQLGRGRVVHFSRVGGKVLLVEPNMRYRCRPRRRKSAWR